MTPSRRLVGLLLAAALLAATLPAATLPAPAGGAADLRRFDRHGIAFSYPRHWHVTTAALSNGVNPIYRFAVGTVPVRRTAQDLGPCLPGVARQVPANGVLAYLREALGADRSSSLPRMAVRPRSFPLPARSDRALCGFAGPGLWLPFKQGGRAFYLGVYVGPQAPAATRRALRRLVDGIVIRRR